MSYIGSSAAPIPVAFSGVRTQSFNGTGSASLFTLNRQVNLVTDIEVIVNNVQQSPFDGSYSIVNNGLGLQFSENPSVGTNNIYVIYRDQPMGSLVDQGAVRKAGDTMTGTLTVGGNVLASPNAGGARVFGVSGGTNTTVVIQSGAASGSGPNLELTADHYAYLDSNTTKFRSTDASLVYGGFDTAGRWAMPNQPAFHVRGGSAQNGAQVIGFSTVQLNIGSHFSLATNRFTAPIAGRYFFNAQALKDSGHADVTMQINKNGSAATDPADNTGSGTYISLNVSAVLELAAGDYVTANIGNGNIYGGYRNFSGYLLG